MPENFASGTVTVNPQVYNNVLTTKEQLLTGNIVATATGNYGPWLTNNVIPKFSNYEGTVTWNGTANNNPINWTPATNPYINQQPYYDPYGPANYPNYVNTFPEPKPKITLNCPHCGESTELTSTLNCTKCFQALVTPNPYVQQGNPYVAFPYINPVVNPGYTFPAGIPNYIPAGPAPAIPPAPKKQKDPEAHPGDGSRWDDL